MKKQVLLVVAMALVLSAGGAWAGQTAAGDQPIAVRCDDGTPCNPAAIAPYLAKGCCDGEECPPCCGERCEPGTDCPQGGCSSAALVRVIGVRNALTGKIAYFVVPARMFPSAPTADKGVVLAGSFR